MSWAARELMLVCNVASAPSRTLIAPSMLPLVRARVVPRVCARRGFAAAGVVGLQAVHLRDARNHGDAADADVHAAVGLGGGGDVRQFGEGFEFCWRRSTRSFAVPPAASA